MAKIYTSVDQLIGHTPLLELTHLEKEFNLQAKIYAKLEYFNPAGSVKDRIGKNMIDEVEKSGALKLSPKPFPVRYTDEIVFLKNSPEAISDSLPSRYSQAVLFSERL